MVGTWYGSCRCSSSQLSFILALSLLISYPLMKICFVINITSEEGREFSFLCHEDRYLPPAGFFAAPLALCTAPKRAYLFYEVEVTLGGGDWQRRVNLTTNAFGHTGCCPQGQGQVL